MLAPHAHTQASFRARPAIVAHADGANTSKPLPVRPHFGGLGFAKASPALSAAGITIGYSVKLPCAAAAAVVAHPACGEGSPGFTTGHGDIDPALASGSITLTANLAFSHDGHTLDIDTGKATASGGVLTIYVSVGGSEVAFGTFKPRSVVANLEGLSYSGGPWVLTSQGAALLRAKIGASPTPGAAITAQFGGNLVFQRMIVKSVKATFYLTSSMAKKLTVAPVAPARRSGGWPSLPLASGSTQTLGLNDVLSGSFKLGGSLTFTGTAGTSSSASVTATDLRIDLRPVHDPSQRLDTLSATVNGKHVLLADLKQADPPTLDDADNLSPTETDDYESVKLTAAGAGALGRPFRTGTDIGTLDTNITVGS